MLQSYKIRVDAPCSILWDFLLDKIENPEKYDESVVDVRILERRTDGSIHRQVKKEVEGASHTFRELISTDYNARSVIYKLVKNEMGLSGFTLNVLYDYGSYCELEYTIHWTHLSATGAAHSDSKVDGGPSTPYVTDESSKADENTAYCRDLLKKSLLEMKKIAESRAQQVFSHAH